MESVKVDERWTNCDYLSSNSDIALFKSVARSFERRDKADKLKKQQIDKWAAERQSSIDGSSRYDKNEESFDFEKLDLMFKNKKQNSHKEITSFLLDIKKLQKLTHEERIRLEFGPKSFNTWKINTSYNFNLPECMNQNFLNAKEKYHHQRVVVDCDNDITYTAAIAKEQKVKMFIKTLKYQTYLLRILWDEKIEKPNIDFEGYFCPW